MSAEELAISFGLTVCLSIVGAFLALRFVHAKEKQYSAFIPQFEEHFTKIVDERIERLKEDLGDVAEEFLTPTVKKAFGALGSLGGEAKAEKGLVDEMATDVLNSPQFTAIKLAASAMGLDLDDYIKRHGAARTISAIQQIASMLHIDITKMDLSSLALPGGAQNPDSGGNPYLGR